MLEVILNKLDVNLILAESGIDALYKIEKQEIALALLDVNMAEMDGVELAIIIQNDKTRAMVPIIFITGQILDKFLPEKCYESGAVDFILKPIRQNILLSKVKVFLELYRQKQNIREEQLKFEKLANELLLINQTLKESNEFNESLLQTIPFGMEIVDE